MPEIPNEAQPGSPEWLLARNHGAVSTPPAPTGAGVGWKLAAFVFGASTVVLAILLAAQLAAPRIVYQSEQGGDPALVGTPAPSATFATPELTDVSQRVGELGLVIMQNYSASTGWPESVDVADGSAVTSDGLLLGEVSPDWIVTYVLAADGSGFTLTLEDENGQSAVFGPAAIDP